MTGRVSGTSKLRWGMAALVAGLIAVAPSRVGAALSGANGSPTVAAATVSPGSLNVPIDAFAITGDGATAISSFRVVFNGVTTGIVGWSIYNVTTATTCYTATTTPTAATNITASPLTGCTAAIPAATTHQFRIRFNAISHAGAVGSFGATANINRVNSTNITEAADGTITVDNQPTAATTGLAGAAGVGQVPLSWTDPVATDLASIIVVHDTAPITWTPSDGTTYSVNQVVFGTVRVGCVVTGGVGTCVDGSSLTAGTPYYFATFALDGYGNYSPANNAGPYAPLSPFVAAGDPTSGSTMPVVSIVNPMLGAVVKAPFKVQARVFSPPVGGNVGTVRLLVDGTAYATAMSPSPQYGTTATSGIWEVRVDTITGGLRELRVEAANANNPGRTVLSSRVTVTASSAAGDGKLLVRDNASQLCSDCHGAVMTHSSETTGAKYGSWAVSCRECHTPHQTHNLGLVRESIKPPEVTATTTAQPVTFRARTGYAATSYASSTNDGPCQVCHTRTSVYRANGNDYDPDTGALVGVSGGHNPTGPCTSCHLHTKGLGAICTDCHGTATRDSLASGGADAHQNAAPPLVASLAAVKVANGGVHVQHVNQATYRTNPLQCADCHTGASHQTSHQVDIKYTALAKTGGVATPLAPPEGALASTFATAPTCTNWCHGDGLPDAGGGVASWTWTGITGGISCGSCHSAPPPVNAAGGDHPQNAACANCHGAGYATTGITVGAKDTHIDGTVQKPTGCRACHGVLQPVGTTPPVATSTDPLAAPGYDASAVDTTGKTNADVPLTLGVGAHQAHVNPAGHGGSPMMSAKACGVCHAMPASDTDTSHANGTTAWGWTAPANSLSTVPTYSAGSCTNYCHSNAKPLNGTPSAPSFTWNSATAMQCTSCHDGASAGTALSHAHQVHTGTYGYGCVRCHVNTAASDAAIVSGGGQHVDGTRDVDFDASGPNNSGGAYDYALYKCSSTYCHSDGVDRTPGYASPASLAWNATSTCGSCHAEGSAMATNAHGAHVNHATTYGKTYGCQTCHYPTTTTGTTITTASNHVNALSDVEGATAGSLKYQDAANTTTNSCTTYCHSSGQAAGTGTPQYYSDMDWKLTTGLGCTSCHGRYSPADPGFTTSYGAPNYVSGGEAVATANSHKKHVSSAADCYVCHKDTANPTGDAIVLSGASHLDGNRQVSFDATKAGASAAYSNDVNKQCSNVSCHGAGSPKWGGPKQACGSCHLRTALAGGDRNDFAGIDNGTSALINSDEWTAVGHGSSAAAFLDANEFGQAGITDRCVYCHDDQNSTANHKQAGNPFRLRGKAAAGGATAAYSTLTIPDTDAVCLNCHDLAANAPAGVDPDGAGGQPLVGPATTRISAYHAGGKHGGDNGGQRCWDCHDPHGDGTNLKMIGVDVLQYAIDASGYAGGRAAATVSFTVRGVGGYTDTVGPTYNGVCQVCHSATDHLAGATGMTYWLANGTGLHNETLDCIGCHTHQQPPNNAFQGAGACSACHMGAVSATTDSDRDEFPPNTSLGGKSLIDPEDWVLTGHGNATTYAQSGNPGGKFPAPSQTVEPCYYCHAPDTALVTGGETSKHTDVATTNPFRLLNTSAGTNPNGVCLVCHAPASAGFDPDGAANLTYAKINRTTSKAISATHHGTKHGLTNDGGQLCWDCHDPHGDKNYGTGREIAYMIQAKPTKDSADAWGNPSALSGVVVDFNKATGGNLTALDGADYVGTGLTPAGVCQVCHTSTTYWTSSGGGTGHQSASGARCESCHDHEQPTDLAFTQATACSACHAAPPANAEHALHVGASTPAYGDVTPHSTTTAYAFGCGKCHSTVSTNHMNYAGAQPYQVGVAFDWASGATPYTLGTVSSDTAASGLIFRTTSGTCATYCHSNATPVGVSASYASPTWAAYAGPLACTACHGGKDSTLTMSASHAKHVNSTGPGYAFTCSKCHQPTITATDNLTLADKSKHVNGNKQEVAFDATNPTGTYSGGVTYTCASTYCHSNASPAGGTALAQSPKWTDAAYVSGCNQCHAMTGRDTTAVLTDLSDPHGKHVDTAAYNFNCDECHASTMAADSRTTVATGGTHVNSAKDVVYATSLRTSTVNQNGTGCMTGYCHSQGVATGSPFTAPLVNTLTWTTTAPATTCVSCHAGNNAATSKIGTNGGSAAHAKHISNVALIGQSYYCSDCHKGTTTGTNDTAVTGFAAHVDGVKTVSIANRDVYVSADADASCAATYCHSTGQRGPASAPVAPKLVNWSDAAWAAGTQCYQCHGTSATFGGPSYGGTGTQDTVNANSHAKHVSAATDCATCHSGAVSTDGLSIPAGTTHTNGLITMGWNTTKTGTVTFVAGSYNSGTGAYTSATCANVKCHGNNATALKWGGPAVSCSDCHMRTALGGGDLNEFTGIDNGTAALVNSDEWAAVGHGQTLATFSEFAAVGVTNRCVYCHDSQNATANHKQAGNPFRLRGKAATGGATAAYDTTTLALTNAVCLNCHDIAANNPAGVDPDGAGGQPLIASATTRISAWHAGGKHGGDDGGERCWDCHDPHGDGTNIKMIGVDVLQYSADASGYAGTRAASTVSFTTLAVGGYIDMTPPTYNGVCQVCHSATDHLAGATGMAYWLNNGTGLHNETQDCIGCHTHQQPPNNAFAGAGACSACHMGAASATTSTDRDEFPPNISLGGKSLVDPEDWLLTGHGNMTTYSQSGNPGGKFPAATQTVEPCYYCHAPDTALVTGGETSKHGDVATTNPFRLLNTTGGTNPNGVCLVCHATGSAGFDPDGATATAYAKLNRTTSKAIGSQHHGAKHDATHSGGALCWDCHDPHGDYNYATGINREIAFMIQAQPTINSTNAWGSAGTFVSAANTVDFNKAKGGVTTTLEGKDYVSTATPFNGVCQVCHTNTVAPGPVAFWTAAGGGTTHSYATLRCTECHAHEKTPDLAFYANPDCTACHDVARGTRRAIVPEFKNTWSHKRSTSPATPANIVVTKWDCVVCHMEGTADANGSISGVHADGFINLRDPDTGLNIKGVTFSGTGAAAAYAPTLVDAAPAKFSRNLGSNAIEADAAAIMVNLCLKCHDDKGAAAFATGGALNAWAVSRTFTAEKPFGQTIQPTTSYVGAGVTANGMAGGVTDINAAFATSNSSYHPIRGLQNNSYCQGTRMVAPWNMTKTNGNATSWGYRMTCWDCHAPSSATNTTVLSATVTAHGATTADYMRGTATVTGTPSATNAVTLCGKCHAGYVTASNQGSHGTGSAISGTTKPEMGTYMSYGCNICHASGYTTAVLRPVRGADSHGVNGFASAGTLVTKTGRWLNGADARPYAFIRNQQVLGDHEPLKIGATSYGINCNMGAGSCSAGSKTYTPGGVY